MQHQAQAGPPKPTVVSELSHRLNALNDQTNLQIKALNSFLGNAGFGIPHEDKKESNVANGPGFQAVGAALSTLESNQKIVDELIQRLYQIA